MNIPKNLIIYIPLLVVIYNFKTKLKVCSDFSLILDFPNSQTVDLHSIKYLHSTPGWSALAIVSSVPHVK